MSYTPDPADYQQLKLGGKTGNVDCTAWAGAWIVAAHTQGATMLSGRAIRLASSEPIPDPKSPGLNDDQVDDAIVKLTSGRVNLDTRSGLSRAEIQRLVIDGRWVSLAVNRGVLVDRGYLSGFRGAHRLTVHARSVDNVLVIGDPLVSHYVPCSSDALFDAAEGLSSRHTIWAQFTRDLTPDYGVSIHPRTGFDSRRFARYFLSADGRIRSRSWAWTGGFSAKCTPPRYHAGKYARKLVQLTSSKRKGWWVNAAWADEEQP